MHPGVRVPARSGPVPRLAGAPGAAEAPSRFLKKKGRERLGVGDEEEAETPEQCSADAEWSEEFNARILAAALERARPHFEPSDLAGL